MAIPQEILLVNVDYVKKLSPLNYSVDDNFIKASMYIAQDKWVQPYLGDALMTKIKNDTAAATISGAYLTLRDSYMVKPIVWWTIVENIPNLTYKIDNGTIAQRISEDTQPIADNVMKDFIDRARMNAAHYTERLKEYLCNNSASFPELSSNTGAQRGPINAKTSVPQVMFSSGNSAISNSSEVKLNRYLP